MNIDPTPTIPKRSYGRCRKSFPRLNSLPLPPLSSKLDSSSLSEASTVSAPNSPGGDIKMTALATQAMEVIGYGVQLGVEAEQENGSVEVQDGKEGGGDESNASEIAGGQKRKREDVDYAEDLTDGEIDVVDENEVAKGSEEGEGMGICVPCMWFNRHRQDKTCSGSSPCTQCITEMQKRNKSWDCYYSSKKIKVNHVRLPDIYRYDHNTAGTTPRATQPPAKIPEPSPSPSAASIKSSSPTLPPNPASDEDIIPANFTTTPTLTTNKYSSVRHLLNTIKKDITFYRSLSLHAESDDNSNELKATADMCLSRILENEKDAELRHFLTKEDQIMKYDIPEGSKRILLEANLKDCLKMKDWRSVV